MKIRDIFEGRAIHSKITFDDLKLSIEVPAKGKRTGRDKSGRRWEQTVTKAYGYILGTNSPDGEHLDCWLEVNPKEDAKVYVVHQLTPDGSQYDEDKVMLGFRSREAAIQAFKENCYKPSKMIGGVTEFDMEIFKIIAYQASNSSAILCTQKMFDSLKQKGLLNKRIKSPIQVAKIVRESFEGKTFTLYHGTCEDTAELLVKNGWEPNKGSVGGNQGQTKYLYLTNEPENALWFAEEKGCNSLVKVSGIPPSSLKVDPEDGTYDTVEEELSLRNGIPGSVVLVNPLNSSHFSLVSSVDESFEGIRYKTVDGIKYFTLFYGTCESEAELLVKNGWKRGSKKSEGQSKYLKLTNSISSATLDAKAKGCNTIVKIEKVPLSYLKIDPDNSSFDSLEKELSFVNGLPGNVILTKPLDASHFSSFEAINTAR